MINYTGLNHPDKIFVNSDTGIGKPGSLPYIHAYDCSYDAVLRDTFIQTDVPEKIDKAEYHVYDVYDVHTDTQQSISDKKKFVSALKFLGLSTITTACAFIFAKKSPWYLKITGGILTGGVLTFISNALSGKNSG